MDTTFFRSREFVIATVLVTCLLGGALAVAGAPNDVRVLLDGHCPTWNDRGGTIRPAVEGGDVRLEGRGAQQDVAYRVDTAGLRTVRVDLCTAVGRIDIVPADGSELLLRVHTHNEGGARAADAVRRSEHVATFAIQDDVLTVHVAVTQVAAARSFLEARSTQIEYELAVPARLVVEARLAADVGDIDVAGVHVGPLDAETMVGRIDVRPFSVRSGPWDLRTDVGDVLIRVPADLEVGYDLVAKTDVGSIDVSVGPADRSDHETRDPPGETAHYTTAGYATKPTRVPVAIHTDVGDILFQTI